MSKHQHTKPKSGPSKPLQQHQARQSNSSADQPAISRGRLFTLLVLVGVVIAVGYVAWTISRTQSGLSETTTTGTITSNPEALAKLTQKPHIVFQSKDDNTDKIVAVTALSDPKGPREFSTLQCERVYFAGGQGICLASVADTIDKYEAKLFDINFQVHHTLPLSGIPSRARVSPSGRHAVSTVFVTGHSYESSTFSTQTTLIDTSTGIEISDLEKFEVWKDDKIFQAPDFNFWGVTFAQDNNRFYATLATNNKTYLIEGDIANKTARVIFEDVECPSLSPDNTRLAFKYLLETGGWQLHVLDLKTMTKTELIAEDHNVDDQVEWLDNDHILYTRIDNKGATPTYDKNIWVLPADGTGEPQLFIPKAASAAVLR